MTTANFVMVPYAGNPDAEVEFVCKECDETMTAMDSDSHAIRRHKASSIRVFNTEYGYVVWVEEQEALRKIRETQSKE